MKYQAVIFDLFGTLIGTFSNSKYTDAVREIASVLSAPVEDFTRLWFIEATRLVTGEYQNFQTYIRHICRQLDIDAPDNLVDPAADIVFSMSKKLAMSPRDGAIEVLSRLKLNNYKTGLISDCGPDVPYFWEELPFSRFIDTAIFSYSAGMNKADPRIFRMAAEKLAVKPEDCIYVADGMRTELANASKLGMYALQLHVPEEIDDNPLYEEWHGPKISSLKEVLNLLE